MVEAMRAEELRATIQVEGLRLLIEKVKSDAEDPGARYGWWEGMLDCNAWGLIGCIMKDGSQDAAEKLHHMLLPGWLWRQQFNGKDHTHTTHGDLMGGEFAEASHPETPARARLVAILDGYLMKIERTSAALTIEKETPDG